MRSFVFGLIAAIAVVSVGLADDSKGKATHHRSTTIVGSSVTVQRTTVGKVTDVVLNSDGCVEYLMVGYKQEHVIVPWTVITLGDKVVTVDVTVEKFRSLTFRERDWSTLHSAEWRRKVTNVYGERAFRRHGDHDRPKDVSKDKDIRDKDRAKDRDTPKDKTTPKDKVKDGQKDRDTPKDKATKDKVKDGQKEPPPVKDRTRPKDGQKDKG